MPTTKKKSKRRPIDQARRFTVIHRDGFICQYCGEKPGAASLEVDHLIPYSMGGSDHENNLVAACVRCNQGKGARLLVPPSMIVDTDDEGWYIIKRFGPWSIRVCEREVVVQNWFYWFESSRFYEPDWLDHISRKPKDDGRMKWSYPDFVECLEFARSLIRP